MKLGRKIYLVKTKPPCRQKQGGELATVVEQSGLFDHIGLSLRLPSKGVVLFLLGAATLRKPSLTCGSYLKG